MVTYLRLMVLAAVEGEAAELGRPLKSGGGAYGALVLLGIEIQFDNPGHHDRGLRTVAVLKHCKPQGFSTINEQPAA